MKATEQQKKELVSIRSKDARSPLTSGTDLGSPPATLAMNPPTGPDTNFSDGRFVSSRRQFSNQHQPVRQQINTDLDEEGNRDRVHSDGLSTQRESIGPQAEARPAAAMSPPVLL